MQDEKTYIIEIEKIKDSLQAQIIAGNNISNQFITGIYASDLMSDVLAYGKSGSILLTGLNSQQAAISAYMAEFKAIVFIRGKIPDNSTKKFAEGKTFAQIKEEMHGMVSEGVWAAKSIHQFALKNDINLPLTTQIYKVLHENKPMSDALNDLLALI